MKLTLLPLKDNALFLQSFRERMRPVQIVAYSLIVIIILSLMATSAFVNEKTYYVQDSHSATPYHGYNLKDQRTVPWLDHLFWQIAIGQGLLLILFGSASANRNAGRERSGGTLDFHRSSPTSRFDQIIGLLLGGPILEWYLFAGTAAVSFMLVFFTSITILQFLKFYWSLILCSLFYHALAVLIAIWSPKIGVFAKGRFGIIKFAFLLYLLCLFFWAFAEMNLPAFFHLTWLPFYNGLHEIIFPNAFSYNRHAQIDAIMQSFFGYPISSTLLQLFVITPLAGLTCVGIGRKISHPENPCLSKPHSSLLIFFIFFLFLGSSFSALTMWSAHYYYRPYNTPVTAITMYLVFLPLIFGLFGTIEATPKRFQYLKGLRRNQKLGRTSLNFSDDVGSNLGWVGLISFITCAIFYLFHFLFFTSVFYTCLAVLTILSYVWFFASAYEYYFLSRFGSKQIMFWVLIAILWLFIPMFGFIVDSIVPSKFKLHFFFAASPVFGTGPIVAALNPFNHAWTSSWAADSVYHGNALKLKLVLTLFINGTGIIVAQLLAKNQRDNLKKEVFG